MKILKDVIRRNLRARGWELTRLRADNGERLDVISALIERAIFQNPQAAILQIGANDAALTDPVFALIRRHDRSAILVEPLPDIFDRLKQNVGGAPKVRLANVAIGSSPGEATIYRINPNTPGMPDWIAGTATFDRDVLMKHKFAPGVPSTAYDDAIIETRVQVVTVRDLLSQYAQVTPIDIVHVDTEGFDFEVVKSVLAAGIRPALISYEHKHLSIGDQEGCRALLADLGYRFFSNDDDTVAQK